MEPKEEKRRKKQKGGRRKHIRTPTVAPSGKKLGRLKLKEDEGPVFDKNSEVRV